MTGGRCWISRMRAFWQLPLRDVSRETRHAIRPSDGSKFTLPGGRTAGDSWISVISIKCSHPWTWRPMRCTKSPEHTSDSRETAIRDVCAFLRTAIGIPLLSRISAQPQEFGPLRVANGLDDEPWSPKSRRCEEGTLRAALPEGQDRQRRTHGNAENLPACRPHVADGPPYAAHNLGFTTSLTNAQRYPETPTTQKRASFT